MSALTLSHCRPPHRCASDGITGTTPAAQKSRDQIDIDARHLADTAQVDRLAVVARQHQLFAEQTLQRAQMQADGPAAEFADLLDDVGVDLV